MKCFDLCVNRGKIYEHTQKIYCDFCSRADSWKTDLYDEGCNHDSENQCDGCRQGLRVINGIHRTKDDKAFMVCVADTYKKSLKPK